MKTLCPKMCTGPGAQRDAAEQGEVAPHPAGGRLISRGGAPGQTAGPQGLSDAGQEEPRLHFLDLPGLPAPPPGGTTHTEPATLATEPQPGALGSDLVGLAWCCLITDWTGKQQDPNQEPPRPGRSVLVAPTSTLQTLGFRPTLTEGSYAPQPHVRPSVNPRSPPGAHTAGRGAGGQDGSWPWKAELQQAAEGGVCERWHHRDEVWAPRRPRQVAARRPRQHLCAFCLSPKKGPHLVAAAARVSVDPSPNLWASAERPPACPRHPGPKANRARYGKGTCRVAPPLSSREPRGRAKATTRTLFECGQPGRPGPRLLQGQQEAVPLTTCLQLLPAKKI